MSEIDVLTAILPCAECRSQETEVTGSVRAK